MKKFISLSVTVLLGWACLAHDTIPKPPTFPPPNNRDTFPDTSRMGRDTSSMWNSNRSTPDSLKQNKEWPNNDTSSMSANRLPGDTLPGERENDATRSRDSLDMNRNADSLNNREQTMKDDWKTNKNQQDTLGVNNRSQDSANMQEADTTLTDRVIMRDDSLLIIQNGEASVLDKEFTLESGATISPEGMVKYPSGKEVQLKNGQFIEITKDSKMDKPAKKTKEGKKTKKSKTTKTSKST